MLRFTAVLTLLALAPQAAADRSRETLPKPGDPRLDKLMAATWDGVSLQDASAIAGGKASLKQHMVMKLASDDSFSGKGTTTLTVNGKTYSMTSDLSGRLERASNRIQLRTRYVKGDNLPSTLVWCEQSDGQLTFFKDKDVADGFILSGKMQSSHNCNTVSDVELTTKM